MIPLSHWNHPRREKSTLIKGLFLSRLVVVDGSEGRRSRDFPLDSSRNVGSDASEGVKRREVGFTRKGSVYVLREKR